MIQWVDQHFRNWGRWVQLGHGLGSMGLSARWDSVGRSNISQAIIPVRDIQLSRTHDWVRSLVEAEQRLLLKVYCTPNTARESAAQLEISGRTLYARLHAVQARYARDRDEDQNPATK